MSIEIVHHDTHKHLQAYVDAEEDEDVQKDGHVLHEGGKERD